MLKHALYLDPDTLRVLDVPAFEVCPRAKGVLWIDLEGTDRADVEWLKGCFGFHPLALEDCLQSGQRPKLDHYDGYAFLDFYSASFDPARARLTTEEIDLFIGEGYLVTAHKAPMPALDEVRTRWQESAESAGGGASYLLYLLLDTVVDEYFPVVDKMEEQLEAFEEMLFERFEQSVITRIFTLKKDLLLMRKVVAPTRDVCLLLLRRESHLIAPGTAVYLQDVYDHLIRVADSIDTYRDLVSGAIDAYLSVIANRTNDTMKRLTSISAVLMSVTLVAGIYGMNFPHMPELSWKWGYEFALGLMIAIALVLTITFKALRYF
ncbi:MAG TPA: magnesium/cobalt transporter CorA [Pantanalinema sp.]